MTLLLLLLFAIVLLVSFIVFIIYWNLIRPQKRFYDDFRRQGIPGEPFVPFVGQLPEMRRASEKDAGAEYRMGLAQKHGYVYLTGFGPTIRLSVIEPDMIADVFSRTHAQDYRKPSDMKKIFKPLIGSHNLLVSEGVEHERARKMLNPAFHFIKLQSMISIMVEQTIKAINELLLLSSEEKVVDLQTELNALTLTIIASSAFGKGFETIANAKQIVCRAFIEVLEAMEYRTIRMIDYIPLIAQLPYWRKDILDQGSREISKFVDQIIADRRHEKSSSLCSGDDLLDLLLSAVDAQGHKFTDQEIKDQALTFVAAGHETTGNLMTWTMYVLMTNKQVLQACRDEVDRVLSNGTEPTYEHINELVICEAVLQETLRLYPPAPFLERQCIREHYIGSKGNRQVRIPAGAKVLINTCILHRRAEFWPQPLEFDYTRWLRDPVTGLKPKLTHSFCYLPFAAGPRNCIGQNFALVEAKVILALLVQRCNFEIEPGQKIVPDVRITMRCKYGLRAKLSKRL
ncbi:unnamed protein product [Rotaria sp. Silwood1]|nr:unnamed protein product [Rotaria sp. Silwood1]CAF4746182.1 unnamed protein product [Rotaria sp. Silwood1]